MQPGAQAEQLAVQYLQQQGLTLIMQNYRSRFAETVRLLFLLRQRFSAADWATAGRLVCARDDPGVSLAR